MNRVGIVGRIVWAALAVASLAAGGCKRALAPTSNIVFRAADGRTLTLDELESAGGPIKYAILGDEDVSADARSLHERGRQAGGSGDYKKAVALLTQASKLAPRCRIRVPRSGVHAPPHEGLRRRADRLSGDGGAGAARILHRDHLRRPARAREEGELPVGTCLAYSLLESVDDPADQAKQLRELVGRVPRLAPAWKDLAHLTEDPTKKLALIEKGLAAQPDAETRGMLQINKALLLHGKDERDHASAIRALGELALDPRSTYATAELAKVSLAVARQGAEVSEAPRTVSCWAGSC